MQQTFFFLHVYTPCINTNTGCKYLHDTSEDTLESTIVTYLVTFRIDFIIQSVSYFIISSHICVHACRETDRITSRFYHLIPHSIWSSCQILICFLQYIRWKLSLPFMDHFM